MGANHRRDRERHHSGNHDGKGQGQRKFPQQPADDPVHENQRSESRDQRQADRQHRETDLPGAFKRRLIGPHPVLEVAVHVLDHDDGVVDHEADRNRERHQRQIVDGETRDPHAGAGSGERQRHRDAGCDRRRQPPQEHEHHEHHEERGCQQRPLHIQHAGADGAGTIDQGGDIDASRNPLLQHGDQRLDPVNGVDDVGIALLGDLDQHCGLLVEPGDRARVADAVLDIGDVRQPYEISVRSLDDDIAELFRRAHLPVERQRLALALAVEDADRTERVGVDDRGADVISSNAGVRQRHGVELDPHRRLIGAAHRHVADTRHL